MKKDWFVIDPQRIQDNDYLRSVSQPTKSVRLLLYEEFIVKQDPLMVHVALYRFSFSRHLC